MAVAAVEIFCHQTLPEDKNRIWFIKIKKKNTHIKTYTSHTLPHIYTIRRKICSYMAYSMQYPIGGNRSKFNIFSIFIATEAVKSLFLFNNLWFTDGYTTSVRAAAEEA